MADTYTIYVVNNETSNETFWCFLQKPEVDFGEKVYANSSNFLTVRPKKSGQTYINKFEIPLQYMISSGADTKAVGLEVRVSSDSTLNVDLGNQSVAKFYPGPEHEGPVLNEDGKGKDPSKLSIHVLPYNQSDEGKNHWWGNLGFGIMTSNGFMGMNWSPRPNTLVTIKPNLAFYISTGDFTPGVLADMSTVSAESQLVKDTDFDETLTCTVTLTNEGIFEVEPGSPLRSL